MNEFECLTSHSRAWEVSHCIYTFRKSPPVNLTYSWKLSEKLVRDGWTAFPQGVFPVCGIVNMGKQHVGLVMGVLFLREDQGENSGAGAETSRREYSEWWIWYVPDVCALAGVRFLQPSREKGICRLDKLNRWNGTLVLGWLDGFYAAEFWFSQAFSSVLILTENPRSGAGNLNRSSEWNIPKLSGSLEKPHYRLKVSQFQYFGAISKK